MPTLVRDYRPILERAGFETHIERELGVDERGRALYDALEARAKALRAEMGAPAETLLDEARNARERRGVAVRTREVYCVARRLAT